MRLLILLSATVSAVVVPAVALAAGGKVLFEDTVPSYERLAAGTYTWRISWSGRDPAPVELTLRW